MPEDGICHAHSGIVTDINNLKEGNKNLWLNMGKMQCKVDKISIAANRILAGITVACILLVINIFIGK